MNPRLVTLTVALVLAIAAMVYLRRTAASLAETIGTESSSTTAIPSKTERIDDDHHPDRLIGLDPSLHQLVRRLEELRISWEHNRPPVRGGHADWNDWREFALKQASQLETSQIEALIDWLEISDNDHVIEVIDYRRAFYQTWASRNPDAAREHVIALAMEYEVLSPEKRKLSGSPYLVDAEEMFHCVFAGSAIHDAPKAWKTFKDDVANPVLRNLPDLNITTAEIFEAYASQDSAEAWRLVLTETDVDFVHGMLKGYTDGAPAGQDWETLGAEFVTSLESHGMEAGNGNYSHIATRWLTEDPVAALDWFADHATLDRGIDPFAPESSPPPENLSPAESRHRLKIELLEDMYSSHKEHTDEIAQALSHLMAEGHSDFAIAALDHFTSKSLNQWATPLLAVVPNIPDPNRRNQVFLDLVKATQPRMHDEVRHSNNPLTEPNFTYEAVRHLGDQLDLPADIRAQAEAAFRRIEEEEELIRTKIEKARAEADLDEPFGPN